MEMTQKIKEILANVMDNPSLAATLSDDADIINDVGIDSLQMIDFLLQLEEEFDIELEFDTLDITHLHSIKSLAAFLASHKTA